MSHLFSPDSKFMQIMNRICDLMLLNILFLLCSIPIFTIGASATALYTVCFRFDTDREGGTIKDLFKAFCSNFRQATGLWLILLLSIGFFPRIILVAVINLFPIALLLGDLYLFLQTGFIWVIVYFSAAAYINSLMLKPVFARYAPPEDTATDE